jgi:hypothetical protein
MQRFSNSSMGLCGEVDAQYRTILTIGVRETWRHRMRGCVTRRTVSTTTKRDLDVRRCVAVAVTESERISTIKNSGARLGISSPNPKLQ